MNRALKIATVLTPFALVACGGNGAMNEMALATSDAVSDVTGPRVTDNRTVYSGALQCLAGNLPSSMVVAVGPIPDKTGKYNIEEDGAILPRSASEMAVTALHRANAKQVDRLTAGIVEWELKFAGKKVLGDGGKTTIKTGKETTADVAYRVIKPGDMLGSTRYITGSISELNWNTFSGGAELNILGIGGGARMFMMTVAVDLKLVDSRSTRILDNVTYKKRILGYETKAGIFRFFGNTLVDFNIGEKSQEPAQLALRSIIERSTYELLARNAGDRRATCDALLEDGDSKVVTLESVPADRIPTADTSGEGDTGGDTTVAPVSVNTSEIGDYGTATVATKDADNDADRQTAWKAAKGGDTAQYQ